MTSNNTLCGMLAAMALCLLAGCNSHAAGAMEEEDHQAPQHKPAGLVEAMPSIRDRLARFQASAATFDREARRKEAGALKDIIQWLPELAAETDLRKADWDSVNAASKRMVARWDEIASRLVDRLSKTDDAGITALERDLEQLERLTRKLSARTDLASGGRAPIP